MNRFLILLIAFFSFQFTNAQEQNTQPIDKIFQLEEVDVKPEYPGGIEAFYKFIAKNFQAPEQEGLNGKIIVAFIIETDGTVTNIVPIQDLGFGTGKAAVDVMKKSEKWIPAQKEGRTVRVVYKFPITIQSAKSYIKTTERNY